MCCVYIIRGSRNTVYVGITKKNLKSKMEEHRKGIGAIKINSPFSLVYANPNLNMSEANLKKNFIKALFKAKCLTFKDTKEKVRHEQLLT